MTIPGDTEQEIPHQMTLHGTVVALDGRGLLILGASGAGKSALALDLIALGAGLVADDLVRLTLVRGELVADRPGQWRQDALIEARGIGILSLPAARPTPVALVVDLGRVTTERLPPARHWSALGKVLPMIAAPATGIHPAALFAALRFGAPLDPDLAVGRDQPPLAHADICDEAVTVEN